jgi:6-phosphogluconolactonase
MPCRSMLRILVVIAGLVALAPGHRAGDTPKPVIYMYVGTYTGKDSQGIYVYRYDAGTGEATPLGLAAEAKNPTFLAIHPSRKFLYAANEVMDFDAARSGAASAFAIDQATGKLQLLNQISSKGGAACAIAIDRAGKYALVANYAGGSVALLPIGKDGRLQEASAFIQHTGTGADPLRQDGPHAHSADFSPDQRFAFANDLGLDRVMVYRFDSGKGSLAPNDPPFAKVPPKFGPRHLAFHPNGRFVYVINELASQVVVFAYDAKTGKLTEMQTLSSLPADFSGESFTAEIAVHPSGRFVYGSNRGHNSLALFSVDAPTGRLTLVDTFPTGGRWPRHFEIDPAGRFLFVGNQLSNDISSFHIAPETGRLTPTGQVLQLASPVCIKFVRID